MSSLPPFSALQTARMNYKPLVPEILNQLKSIKFHADFLVKEEKKSQEGIAKLFPHTYFQPFLSLKSGLQKNSSSLKIGVLFSGGQAPGGHNVVAGILDALLELNKESELIGFLNGPEGLINSQYKQITLESLFTYRNQGGFDLLGSGRTKIESKQQIQAAIQTVSSLNLDGLVIIGGDDSNTNSAFLAEAFEREKVKTCVVGVPKTIDGDLKNEQIEISFGYDTACKTYSEIIGNLAKDALSAKKYYFFVKMMGRSASHIALECAVKTQINMVVIGEEIAALKMSLDEVVKQIANLICKRADADKYYGVILIPEGIVEFIEEFKQMIQEVNQLDCLKNVQKTDLDQVKEALSSKSVDCLTHLPDSFQKQLLLERDCHGNVQVSKIEIERLLIDLVQKELITRSQFKDSIHKFSPQPFFCGYEGRSAFPSNFDSNYCYALGKSAALLIESKANGYLATISGLGLPVEKWAVSGTPIAQMLHFENRKGEKKAVIQKGIVDLDGKIFQFYQQQKERWAIEDNYQVPGPIQFQGDLDLTDAPPLILKSF